MFLSPAGGGRCGAGGAGRICRAGARAPGVRVEERSMAGRGARRARAALRLLVAALLLPGAAGKRVRARVPTGERGSGGGGESERSAPGAGGGERRRRRRPAGPRRFLSTTWRRGRLGRSRRLPRRPSPAGPAPRSSLCRPNAVPRIRGRGGRAVARRPPPFCPARRDSGVRRGGAILVSEEPRRSSVGKLAYCRGCRRRRTGRPASPAGVPRVLAGGVAGWGGLRAPLWSCASIRD